MFYNFLLFGDGEEFRSAKHLAKPTICSATLEILDDSSTFDLQSDAKFNLGCLWVRWPLALRREPYVEKTGFHIPLEIGSKLEKLYHLGNFSCRKL